EEKEKEEKKEEEEEKRKEGRRKRRTRRRGERRRRRRRGGEEKKEKEEEEEKKMRRRRSKKEEEGGGREGEGGGEVSSGRCKSAGMLQRPPHLRRCLFPVILKAKAPPQRSPHPTPHCSVSCLRLPTLPYIDRRLASFPAHLGIGLVTFRKDEHPDSLSYDHFACGYVGILGCFLF
ncbi:hypothetical protein L345_17616, partial [Ophiophagus hannah]